MIHLSGLHNLQPHVFAGLLDDPLLWVRNRCSGRGLLFDCGQLHHLAKRLLMGLEAVFISHAHMDHFMGVDLLLRHLHAADRTLDLFGPPGLADRFRHKLGGYDWNLAEEFWATFRVTELGPDSRRTFVFPGPKGFCCRPQPPQPLHEPFFANEQIEVRAALCEHRIPSLSYRIDERPEFLVDEARLRALELLPGPWIDQLKRCLRAGNDAEPIAAPRRQPDGTVRSTPQPAATLYRSIRREITGGSIGYLADVGYTAANRERIIGLLRGVTLLVCECTFLARHRDRARASAHLCTEDVNALLDALRPTYVLPLHLSKRYRGASARLYAELAPPPGTTLLRLPEFRTPRPLLPEELKEREKSAGD